MRRDLVRPHVFAAERIGFAAVRIGNAGNDPTLILVEGYSPVADENYIDDPKVGARINSAAIRTAMQMAIDQRCGAFHVHLHINRGKPRLSRTDRTELPRV